MSELLVDMVSVFTGLLPADSYLCCGPDAQYSAVGIRIWSDGTAKVLMSDGSWIGLGHGVELVIGK